LGIQEYECQCQQYTMEDDSAAHLQWLMVVQNHLWEITLYFHYEQPICS